MARRRSAGCAASPWCIRAAAAARRHDAGVHRGIRLRRAVDAASGALCPRHHANARPARSNCAVPDRPRGTADRRRNSAIATWGGRSFGIRPLLCRSRRYPLRSASPGSPRRIRAAACRTIVHAWICSDATAYRGSVNRIVSRGRGRRARLAGGVSVAAHRFVAIGIAVPDTLGHGRRTHRPACDAGTGTAALPANRKRSRSVTARNPRSADPACLRCSR